MGIFIGKGFQRVQGSFFAIHDLIADHADLLGEFHDIHVDASFSLFSVSNRFHTGPTAGCPGSLFRCLPPAERPAHPGCRLPQSRGLRSCGIAYSGRQYSAAQRPAARGILQWAVTGVQFHVTLPFQFHEFLEKLVILAVGDTAVLLHLCRQLTTGGAIHRFAVHLQLSGYKLLSTTITVV